MAKIQNTGNTKCCQDVEHQGWWEGNKAELLWKTVQQILEMPTSLHTQKLNSGGLQLNYKRQNSIAPKWLM